MKYKLPFALVMTRYLDWTDPASVCFEASVGTETLNMSITEWRDCGEPESIVVAYGPGDSL